MKAFLLNILIFTICAVAVFEILSACAPARQEEIPDFTPEGYIKIEPGVYRIVDKEAQVVCWLYSGNGVDCLPLADTKLSKE